jgi:hypothetical protein
MGAGAGRHGVDGGCGLEGALMAIQVVAISRVYINAMRKALGRGHGTSSEHQQ